MLICTGLAMAIGFRLRRGEQDPLIRAEQLAHERAEAEKRYRILADNAVDVIVHLRGTSVAWVSPSVQPRWGSGWRSGSARSSAVGSIPTTSPTWWRCWRSSARPIPSVNGCGYAPPMVNTAGSTVTRSCMSMPMARPTG